MKQQFSIWAPLAKSMSLQVEGKVVPMLAGEHGWWTVDAEADHGTDYGFLIDQDPHGYPDPKSLWQPEGVHAASRVLDHGRFKWSDHGWQPAPLSKAIIYELHVGTFTPGGTFVSTIDKLADLKSLGVTHVELLPVNSFAGRWGWGYDGVSLYAPQEAYGGPDGLKQLVDACHAHGMALLMDVVYNHFGPVGNYAGKFGPYTTENHHTPWGGAVNLDDAGSTEVRRFFCDNALMWLRDYHIDGLRLDAVHAYVDRSAKHLLEQLAEEVEQLSSEVGKPLVLIAESDLNDPRIVTPRTDPSDSEVCGTRAAMASTPSGATTSITLSSPNLPVKSEAITVTSEPSNKSPKASRTPTSSMELTPSIATVFTAARFRSSVRTAFSAIFKIMTRLAIVPSATGSTQ